MDLQKLKKIEEKYNNLETCESKLRSFELGIIGGVITLSREKADNYMDQYYKKLKISKVVSLTSYLGISSISRKEKGRSIYYINTSSHYERWIWEPWEKSCTRGHKFNKLIVDPDIPEDIFLEKILPMCPNCNHIEIMQKEE